jgi:hypothetical protein
MKNTQDWYDRVTAKNDLETMTRRDAIDGIEAVLSDIDIGQYSFPDELSFVLGQIAFSLKTDREKHDAMFGSNAAKLLRSIPSKKRSDASAKNGKKGGRPKSVKS